MPASKRSHVLALLRVALNLKQDELAKLAGCSTATIQSIELSRLTLSDSLAARISAATGVDLNWLRANDIKVPVPPIRALVVTTKLTEAFRKLFAWARLDAKGPERETLALYIAWELNRLKTEPYRPLRVEVPASSPEWVRKIEEAERRYDEAQHLSPEEQKYYEELDRRYFEENKQEKQSAKGSQRNPKKEPKALAPGKASALALKAPRRSRRSA